MKATLRKIFLTIGVIWCIALIIAGFLAYFITSSGPLGIADGLGRSLTDAPLLMRIMFGQERLWAGFGWFLGEMVIFWGSISIAVGVAKWLDE